MATKFGIIIVRYGLYDISTLAQDIYREGIEKNQVLIVHNSAHENDWQDTKNYGFNVHIMNGNSGYSGAVNEGIRYHLQAGADIIGVLTHDVQLSPHCLQQLVQELCRDQTIGILGPSLSFEVDDKTIVTYGGSSSALTGTGHSQNRPISNKVFSSEWIDGSIMVISRQAIASVGLFNEKYFLYYEDAEWCFRCSRGGYAVSILPTAHASQRPGGSSRRLAYTYLVTRNSLDYALKRFGYVGLTFGLLRAVGTAFRCILSAVRNPAGYSVKLRTAKAVLCGVHDFARGRWGPPPQWVLKDSDISI